MSLIFDNLRSLQTATSESGRLSHAGPTRRRGMSVTGRLRGRSWLLLVLVALGGLTASGVVLLSLNGSLPKVVPAQPALKIENEGAGLVASEDNEPPSQSPELAFNTAHLQPLALEPQSEATSPPGAQSNQNSAQDAPFLPVSEPVPEPAVRPEAKSPVRDEPAPATVVVSSAPTPMVVNRLRSQLILALDDGDVSKREATLGELRDLLEADSPFLRRIEAFVLLRTQQWRAAELAYDALLLENREDADARFHSGWLAIRRGDHEKAENRLRPLQRHPEYRQQVAGLLAEIDRQARVGL